MNRFLLTQDASDHEADSDLLTFGSWTLSWQGVFQKTTVVDERELLVGWLVGIVIDINHQSCCPTKISLHKNISS